MASLANPLVCVGLRISMPLGSTRHFWEAKAQALELKSIDAEDRVLKDKVAREVRQAWLEWEHQKELYHEHGKFLKGLRTQLQVEDQRFRQARSDEVASLRYQMEVVAAEMNQLEALRQQREAEITLKWLGHRY